MIRYFKQAINDIIENRFLSIVAVITIALSLFIVSASGLFFLNADKLMATWKREIRIMVYLKPEIHADQHAETEEKLRGMYGVSEVKFISKEQGLALLKEKMVGQSSLLENLAYNPLPDAFEISMADTFRHIDAIEELADQIESLHEVDDVEYGRRYLGWIIHVLSLFKLAGYAIGCLFFMATAFIVANTIRLVLYSRREEVEIMRLVGATNTFIKVPFYVAGLILGAAGGIIGIGLLFLTFIIISANLPAEPAAAFFQIVFYPASTCLLFIAVSMVIGWIGCYLSLRQFLST